MPKIQIETAISAETKQAEKQIKDFSRAMSTIEGQKNVFINVKVEGAEAIQKRLEESIKGLKGIKFDNKGVMTQVLGIEDARKALRQLEGELSKTAGRARSAVQDKIGRVSAYIGAYNEAIEYRANQLRSGRAVSSQKQLGNYYNEGRQVRIQQINESLATARLNSDYREQLRLLKEKANLLEKIDKANRAKTPNPEIAETRAQIAAINQKAQANKSVEAQQRKQVDYERLFGAEVKKTTGNLAAQGGIMRNLVSIFRRYISLFTIIDVARKMAETTGYFEQQQVALEGILGSAAEAQKAISKIKALALESPFQTKDLVAYTKQLSAYGIENDKLVGTMKDLADISAGLGVDMGRLILAYGQVKSAAVLRGQELRQFTEAGIPMVQALADKFTALNGKLVTTGEVFKLISERKVPFEMVASVLADMTKEGGKFYNMQANLTETLYGQIQKLKDVWTLALNDAGSGIQGTIMGVVKAIQVLLQHIQGFLTGGTFAAAIAALNALRRNSLRLQSVFRLSRIEAKLIGVEITNAAIRTRQAKGAANQWATALRGVGRVAAQIGRFLATPVGMVAVSVLAGAITDAVIQACQFQKELDEIDASFDKNTRKQKQGLDDLIGKLSVATNGTKAYNDAMSALKTNYSDYVNDGIIDQLLKEQEALRNTGKSWADLAEKIKKAIEAKAEYQKNETRAEEASDEIFKEVTDSKWWRGFQNAIEQTTTQVNNGAVQGESGKTYIDKAIKKEQKDQINNAIKYAIEDFFGNKGTTLEEFKKAVRKNAKIYAAGFEDQLVDVAKYYFADFSKGGKWDAYVKAIETNKNDVYFLNKKAFENARAAAANSSVGAWVGSDFEKKTKSEKSKAYDPFKWYQNEDRRYLNAAVERYNALTRGMTEDMLAEGGKDAAKKVKEEFEKPFNAGKTQDVATALTNFANAVKDPDLKAHLQDVSDLLIQFAGVKTGIAAKISTKIEENFGKGKNESAVKKDYFARFLPDDKTLDKLRNDIQSRYSDVVKEIESHGATVAPEWKERVDALKEEREWLKELASDKYYDFELKDPKGAGRNKHAKMRIVNFFDDILAMIVKADDAAKKVAGVQGWTDAMSEFFQSLDPNSPNSFLREFFVKGGKPFDKFFKEISEYGVTEFLPKGFDAQNIESIFRNAGWEPDKEFSAPDFEKMYRTVLSEIGNTVLEGIKKKAKSYKEGTTERNSLDSQIVSLQDFIAKSAKNADVRWGGDEVSRKISEAIKTLNDIKLEVSDIKNRRDLFERAAKSSNYLRAQKGIYGNYDYSTYSPVSTARNQLANLLQSDAAKGIAGTAAGTALTERIIKGGALNIDSIGALLDIYNGLMKQAGVQHILDENGNETTQTLPEQFKDVVGFFTDGIKDLVEALMREFDELMALNDKVGKNSDAIIGVFRSYKDAIDAIDRGEKSGAIGEDMAKAMRLNAIQKAYAETSKDLFAKEIPDYINRLYSESNGTTGLSQRGLEIGTWLSGGNLTSIYGQMEAKKLQGTREDLDKQLKEGTISSDEYQKKLNEAVQRAAKALQTFSDKMQLTSSIISKVDSYIQKSAKFANDLIGALEANNGLTKDQYGNYTYENDYSDAKAAINMIADFSSGISGAFQSLMSGDIFGALMGVGSTIAKFFENLFGLGDSQIQKQQDQLISSNKALQRAMGKLQNAINDLAGKDKWDNLTEQIGNLRDQEANNRQLESLEVSKKHGDADKAEAFRNEADEADQQVKDIVRSIREQIFGTADELASTLTDAMVEAFRNGENAARAWRDSVRSYIGDVLKEVLMTNVIAPKIQSILDSFGIKEGETSAEDILSLFMDPSKSIDLKNQLFAAGDELQDWFNNLAKPIQEMIAWNSDTSVLSGGIQAITEDTARTLEGLSYSMLAQLVLIQRSVLILESSGFAQVQTSWFNDMLTQQRALRQAADSINGILEGSRDGTRSLQVRIE